MDSGMLEKIVDLIEAGTDVAIATIISTKGSTPRKAGTKMLITPGGIIYGTVGGGCGEAGVKREALTVIDTKSPVLLTVDLTNDVAAGEGMVCGGKMDLFIDYIDAGESGCKEFFKALLLSVKKREKVLLFTVVSGETGVRECVGRKTIISGESIVACGGELPENIYFMVRSLWEKNKINSPQLMQCQVSKYGNVEVLVEPGILPPEVLILGGGHIAVPLSRMADMLGYRFTVVDDRPLFANRERYPKRGEIICKDFETALKDLHIGPETFAVIITRGHKYDFDCLRELISRPAGYIGMIGSSRKVKAVMSELEEEGIEKGLLEKVYSPIGLDIGAQTPEEIALSIMSEIVAVYRGGGGAFLKAKT
ncbi:MAG: XdhC family protein [Bacillota bacterium]